MGMWSCRSSTSSDLLTTTLLARDQQEEQTSPSSRWTIPVSKTQESTRSIPPAFLLRTGVTLSSESTLGGASRLQGPFWSNMGCRKENTNKEAGAHNKGGHERKHKDRAHV